MAQEVTVEQIFQEATLWSNLLTTTTDLISLMQDNNEPYFEIEAFQNICIKRSKQCLSKINNLLETETP
jgi:hypothetical protein